MALIELDLTAQPDPVPGIPPPAHRYRIAGLVSAVVLLLALGGAAPAASRLWQYLGPVPPPGGPEAPFQLAPDRVYTIGSAAGFRAVTAWSVQRRPRRLWTVRFPARVAGADDVAFGGVEAVPAGEVVLFADGPTTTAVDRRTGQIRWTSPVGVTPLPGGRVGVTQVQRFRAGTVYDESSGDPGMIYFSATGEPHTEPPVTTDVHGIDLRTGATVWTAPTRGAVNVFAAPGAAPAVLILASDKVERRAGDTGAVRSRAAMPRIGDSGPRAGELIHDVLVVSYGNADDLGRKIAYRPDTLRQRWARDVRDSLLDPPRCQGLLCAGSGSAPDVLDPATGRPAWRARYGADLAERGGAVLETVAARQVRLVDQRTGALRLDLRGWLPVPATAAEQPLVVRRTRDDGRAAFGVVRAGRDAVQPLGVSDVPVSDCIADARYVVCRAVAGLRIWAYRG